MEIVARRKLLTVDVACWNKELVRSPGENAKAILRDGRRVCANRVVGRAKVKHERGAGNFCLFRERKCAGKPIRLKREADLSAGRENADGNAPWGRVCWAKARGRANHRLQATWLSGR